MTGLPHREWPPCSHPYIIQADLELYKQLDRHSSASASPLLLPHYKWLSSMCELLLLARYLVCLYSKVAEASLPVVCRRILRTSIPADSSNRICGRYAGHGCFHGRRTYFGSQARRISDQLDPVHFWRETKWFISSPFPLTKVIAIRSMIPAKFVSHPSNYPIG